MPTDRRLLAALESRDSLDDRSKWKNVGWETGILRSEFAFDNSQNGEEDLWLDIQNDTAVVADSALFDSLSHGPDVKPVSGIGDQALWSHSQIGTFLYVLKGGNMVAVGLPRTIAEMTPATGKAGRLIASRM